MCTTESHAQLQDTRTTVCKSAQSSVDVWYITYNTPLLCVPLTRNAIVQLCCVYNLSHTIQIECVSGASQHTTAAASPRYSTGQHTIHLRDVCITVCHVYNLSPTIHPSRIQ